MQNGADAQADSMRSVLVVDRVDDATKESEGMKEKPIETGQKDSKRLSLSLVVERHRRESIVLRNRVEANEGEIPEKKNTKVAGYFPRPSIGSRSCVIKKMFSLLPHAIRGKNSFLVKCEEAKTGVGEVY